MFFFFGGWTCLCVIWVALCVPETKGLPLEEVQGALRRWGLTRVLVRVLKSLGVAVDPAYDEALAESKAPLKTVEGGAAAPATA